MNPLEILIAALNARMNQVLLVAEAALPQSQFQAFRKFALDQFGRSGFQRDLEKVLSEHPERNGMGRPISAKKGGVP